MQLYQPADEFLTLFLFMFTHFTSKNKNKNKTENFLSAHRFQESFLMHLKIWFIARSNPEQKANLQFEIWSWWVTLKVNQISFKCSKSHFNWLIQMKMNHFSAIWMRKISNILSPINGNLNHSIFVQPLCEVKSQAIAVLNLLNKYFNAI